MVRSTVGVALLCASATLPSAPPSPPASLTSYVAKDRFDPGDYGWLRGRFSGATAAERASGDAVDDWRRRCKAASDGVVRAELAALGVTSVVASGTIPIRDPICAQASFLPHPLNLDDWEGFARDVRTVRPIGQAYLSAVVTAEMVAAPGGSTTRDALDARLVGEQILRFGLAWADGGKSDSPALTAGQRAILVSTISVAIAQRDHANTQRLKGVVATDGWPRRSEVGDGAAQAAWLLVQHADADPAFQLRALRLMEPLVATGEVSRKNYAYLYDRVMLTIAGRQRYATQMTCRGGQYVPQPLEDAASVDARRREVGLGGLAQYRAQMIEAAGPCPPATPGAAVSPN